MHDMFAAIWGSPLVADGKVYLGDEDGDVVVLQPGKKKKVLAEMNMGSSVYSTAVPANGALFIAQPQPALRARRQVARTHQQMMHPLRTAVALLGGMIAVRPAGAPAPDPARDPPRRRAARPPVSFKTRP